MRARALLLVVAASPIACTNDFDFRFASSDPAGAATSSSSSTSTSTSTSSSGSTGGAGGGGGAGGEGGIPVGPGGGGAGGSGPVCPPGKKPCGAACVSVNDVNFGCGGPSCSPCVVPHATAACVSGACGVGTCAAGFVDCNGLPGDGCEAHLDTDVQNCGACGRPCATNGVASLACTGGVCTPACALGFASCGSPPAPDADDGCELDVKTALNDCGGCGNACSAQGPAFDSMECDRGPGAQKFCGCSKNSECRLGLAGGTCTPLIGLCSCDGVTCAPSEACVRVSGADVCSCNGGAACAPGESCCQTPAGCRDLSSDPSSCGACGHACPAGFACASGACACSGDVSCDAGTVGAHVCQPDGTCSCNGTPCAPGQRCQASGTCG